MVSMVSPNSVSNSIPVLPGMPVGFYNEQSREFYSALI